MLPSDPSAPSAMAPAPLLHTSTPAPAVESNGVATKKAAAARSTFRFDTVEEALAAFGRGEFVVVMDDENRENEGDLIVAGAAVTTQQMAWMIKHTSGYICLSLPGERLDELSLPMMVPENQDPLRTAYAVTVDYRHGTTTGISAHDRALTARQLASGSATAADFIRPGHLVPLRARPAGVLERRGHTEAGLDLCRLTGQPPAGLLAEIVNDDVDGTMARGNDCRAFADRWGLKMISIDMLARYCQQQQSAA
ncbi:hypothetical protein AURDEDRAFT_113049 [Auricularia subglabra TFB-10046 SS5]|nr:hypothetical protein AURDEDRAFT_113049 [Auricularia subglabra TFB-10046 SS5]